MASGPRVAEQECAAVRLRLDHVQRCDIAAKAGTIIEFDRRPEARTQRLAQRLQRCRAGASGRKRDHDLDRLGILRGRRSSRPRQSRRTDDSQRGTARHKAGRPRRKLFKH